MRKLLEQIYPFGSQHPSVTNAQRVSDFLAAKEKGSGELSRKQKALQRSAQIQNRLFTRRPAMNTSTAENKVDDRIYSMAFIKEALNLSKEEKIDLLEFILTEPDMKKVITVVEKYVSLDEGIWDRVTEATKRVKSLFYTNPAGKKDLKFAGKKPKAMNKPLSDVVTGEGKEWVVGKNGFLEKVMVEDDESLEEFKLNPAHAELMRKSVRRSKEITDRGTIPKKEYHVANKEFAKFLASKEKTGK